MVEMPECEIPTRTAKSKWNKFQRERSVLSTEKCWISEEFFDIRHGDTEFRICHASLKFFGPEFPHYDSSPPI